MSQIITPATPCDACGQPVGPQWVFHRDLAKLLCHSCQINSPRNRPPAPILVDETGCPVQSAAPMRVNGHHG